MSRVDESKLSIFDIHDYEGLYTCAGIEPIFVGTHYVEVESEYYVDNRFREEAWILQYTLSGQGLLLKARDKERGSRYSIGPQSCFLIHVPEESSYTLHPEADNWELLFLKFRGALPDTICTEVLSRNGPHIIDQKQRIIEQQLKDLYQEAALQAPIYPHRVVTHIFSILTELHAGISGADTYDSGRMRSAAGIFRSRYANPKLSIQSVAAELNLSRSHFSRLFTKHTGTSPKRFLLTQRFTRARELLLSSCYTVAEIAELSGFSSASHFSHLFHHYFGQSPLQYRCSSAQKHNN